jgi:Domain of unknown function (DUF4394)
MRSKMSSGALALGVLLGATALEASADSRDRVCGKGRGPKLEILGRLEVIGLTSDQRLICFAEAKPGRAREIGLVTGLTTDSKLVGIDFRPANGQLYGLGDAGGIYTLDLSSAAATFQARLNVPLQGTNFGVDFNPVPDRLRIVSDTGQNLRVNVADGVAAVDTTLSYTAGTATTGIVGAAYTNNDADPNTATTLFDIDSALDQVAIQAPPNAGSLNLTGKLGVDTGSNVGFDIYSRVRGTTTRSIHAFASLTSGDQAQFYRIELFTGVATLRGSFRSQDQVIDIALPLNQR